MNNDSFYNIRSEVGKLEAVLLHRPGRELERLTPQYLEDLLFDDIPWLVKMQEEHDLFAKTLESRGCKIYYYDELLKDILLKENVKNMMISEISTFSGIDKLKEYDAITNHLQTLSADELSKTFIAGLHKDEINYKTDNRSLSYYIKDDYPFYINPLPNLYFTRDPGAVIGNGISIHSMKTSARNRETMILSYIHKYHDEIKSEQHSQWYDYNESGSIEGGDVLILNKNTIAVGCSARTSPVAIEKLAENLFTGDSGISEVIVLQIPFKRAYMHLDTVFTMVDRDKFTIFPEIEKELKVFTIKPGINNPSDLIIRSCDSLEKTLCKSLNIDKVTLIQSGGGDKITAAREQWNDSTNTLALAPGVVVTYRRNTASNNTLRDNGIEVVEIEGSELVRGRGGPRCMSMPLRRCD